METAERERGPTPAMAAQDLDHVARPFRHLGLRGFARKMSPRVLWAGYVFLNGCASVGLLTAQAFCVNRLAGLPYPV